MPVDVYEVFDGDDKVALFYMQRATQYAEQGVPADWDGVTKMVEK